MCQQNWGNSNPDATRTLTQGTSLVNATRAKAIAALNPLRYAGYAWDAESGMYYCSQRYYDPATYQFVSKDPARADGEQSAYQYCGGDPVGKVDPSGALAADYYGADYWDEWRLHLRPREAMLSVAHAELGEHEDAQGATKYGKWYVDAKPAPRGFAKADWCDMFISWCAAKSGNGHRIGMFALTTSHQAALSSRRVRSPRRGAIVFFALEHPHTDHVGIIERVNRNGTFVTIEGNTNDRGSGRGYKVAERVRSGRSVTMYAYPW